MRATLSIAFVAILARPATWPLALLTFLVRGGLLIAAAPILVLPSAVGLANVIVPWLTTLVFVGLTGPVLIGIAGGAVAIGTWIVAGGWLAAAAELEGSASSRTRRRSRARSDAARSRRAARGGSSWSAGW